MSALTRCGLCATAIAWFAIGCDVDADLKGKRTAVQEQCPLPVDALRMDPVLQWTSSEGLAMTSVVAEPSGNLIVGGWFSSDITIEGETYLSLGGRDGYVASVTPEGTLRWFRRFGGKLDDAAVVVRPMDHGHIALVGVFEGDCHFGTETEYGSRPNGFVAVLDENGTFQWVDPWSSDAYDTVPGVMIVGASGAIRVAGAVDWSALVGGNVVTGLTGPLEAVLVDYAPTGQVEYAGRLGVDWATQARPSAMAEDKSGNLVIGGGRFAYTNTERTAFLSQWSPAHALNWSLSFGSLDTYSERAVGSIVLQGDSLRVSLRARGAIELAGSQWQSFGYTAALFDVNSKGKMTSHQVLMNSGDISTVFLAPYGGRVWVAASLTGTALQEKGVLVGANTGAIGETTRTGAIRQFATLPCNDAEVTAFDTEPDSLLIAANCGTDPVGTTPAAIPQRQSRLWRGRIGDACER